MRDPRVYPGKINFIGDDMTILEKAEDLVAGDRQEGYGHPADNFKQIANLWSAYVNHAYNFQYEDVAAMMILLKVARGLDKYDTLVDIAGYARCVEMIQDNYKSIQSDDGLPF